MKFAIYSLRLAAVVIVALAILNLVRTVSACPPVQLQSVAVQSVYGAQAVQFIPQAVQVQSHCPAVAVQSVQHVQSYAQVQAVQVQAVQAYAVPVVVQAVAVKQVHVQAAPRARIFGGRSVVVQKSVTRVR